MTILLSKAVNEIEKLPVEVQDSLASVLLEQIITDDRWEEVFAEEQTREEVFA